MQIRGSGVPTYADYEIIASREELEILYHFLNNVGGYGTEPASVVYADEWKPSENGFTATQVREVLTGTSESFLAQIERALALDPPVDDIWNVN